MAKATRAQLHMLGNMVRNQTFTIMPRGGRWATARILIDKGWAIDISEGVRITTKGLEVLRIEVPELYPIIKDALPLIGECERRMVGPAPTTR